MRCLERQVAILQDQNRQLIEELQKMKALCAGAFLDPSRQQAHMSNTPGGLSNDRRLGGSNETGGGGGGIDFVDSATSSTHLSHNHPQHLLCKVPPPHLSPLSHNNSKTSTNSTNNFNAPSEMDADSSSASRSLVSNDLTLLKSPVSQAQQQLLLHGLSALTEGGVRKSEEGDYSTGPAWMSSLSEQKPSKFSEEETDTNRPPSASPHIHPVKRVLKRFGNEQHRLSQQQKLHQQNVGKLDQNKT